MLYKILTFQSFFLIFLFLIETTSSAAFRKRRQAADELLAQLGDSPRDELAKLIVSKKEGEKFEGGKKQAEYLMRIENFLNERGEGFKDPDNEWLAMARQRAREGRLRYKYFCFFCQSK